jgi:hypothetical protein
VKLFFVGIRENSALLNKDFIFGTGCRHVDPTGCASSAIGFASVGHIVNATSLN